MKICISKSNFIIFKIGLLFFLMQKKLLFLDELRFSNQVIFSPYKEQQTNFKKIIKFDWLIHFYMEIRLNNWNRSYLV
jgi:hypothetical protein